MTPAPLSPEGIDVLRTRLANGLHVADHDVLRLLATIDALQAQATAAIPNALTASEEMEGLKVRVARLEEACSFALQHCSEAFNAGDYAATCNRVIDTMEAVLNPTAASVSK